MQGRQLRALANELQEMREKGVTSTRQYAPSPDVGSSSEEEEEEEEGDGDVMEVEMSDSSNVEASCSDDLRLPSDSRGAKTSSGKVALRLEDSSNSPTAGGCTFEGQEQQEEEDGANQRARLQLLAHPEQAFHHSPNPKRVQVPGLRPGSPDPSLSTSTTIAVSDSASKRKSRFAKAVSTPKSSSSTAGSSGASAQRFAPLWRILHPVCFDCWLFALQTPCISCSILPAQPRMSSTHCRNSAVPSPLEPRSAALVSIPPPFSLSLPLPLHSSNLRSLPLCCIPPADFTHTHIYMYIHIYVCFLTFLSSHALPVPATMLERNS